MNVGLTLVPRLGAALLLLALAACATGPGTVADGSSAALPAGPGPQGVAGDAAAGPEGAGDAIARRGFVDPGSGRLVGSLEGPPQRWRASSRGEITLNFDGADLREVVKVILGDILGVNYLIDERVRGQATLHTNHPVGREALAPILEAVLQMNGAAMVVTQEGYQVLPIASAIRQGLVPDVGTSLRGGPGFRLQVVPLRYIAAGAIHKVLEPFIPEGASLRADEARNLLIIAGPPRALAELLQTVGLFDVDWLAGMSFGLFPLEQAEAKVLIEELGTVLGTEDDGLLKGLIRLVPIERLNAVLVISKRPEYLERVRGLIARFDQGGGGAGRRLHVYHLRHGKADDLAGVLGDLFAKEGQGPVPVAASAQAGVAAPAPAGGAAPAAPAQPVSFAPALPAEGDEGGSAVQIIADAVNNALLVMATPAEYAVIESAIRKLDIERRQVLVEATIAEITLTDNLQYGLQWFLRGSLDKYSSLATLSSTASASFANAVVPGFSYSLTDGAGVVRLLFDTLANESKLKILSSPQVLVIDNQTANIRVGDQIPIITRSTSSVSDPDSPIVNEVQFRDTGVLLQVTPHINAGGMVTLEISQEVSEPSADEFAAGNVSILQRSITSQVAVQSGETVVLGGLIRENKTFTVSGIPGLSKIPLLGKLFSRTVDNTSRTELVVTITPRVITSRGEAREASRELVRRMRNLRELEADIFRATDRPASEAAPARER